MNPSADWLQQLAPAHAPAAAAWWPPAPGWWLLSVLLLGLAGLTVAWWRNPLRRLRRLARTELRELEAARLSDAELAQRLENLLRRYAVARYGTAAVAALTGQRWLEFVCARGGAALAGAAGAALLSLAYGGAATAERERWLTAARGFIGHGGRR